MNTFRIGVLLVLAVVTMTIVACNTAIDPASGPADVPPETQPVSTADNTHCPMMGGKVTAEGGRVDWNGKTIGFCCPDCIEEWNKLSDTEKEAKLKATAAEQNDSANDQAEI